MCARDYFVLAYFTVPLNDLYGFLRFTGGVIAPCQYSADRG